MNQAHWKLLEATCRGLVSGSGTLTWSWDGRFGAALATFPARDAASVEALLGSHFPLRIDAGNLRKAPDCVRNLAKSIGGVRSDQWLYSTDPALEVLVVGAWWPWGGGQTISIRMFPVENGLPRGERDAFTTAFRSWFGLTP